MIGCNKESNVAQLVLQKFDMPEQKPNTNQNADPNNKRPNIKPSLLLNPTFFNNPRIRMSSIPSANGFCSAQALANFYSSILDDSLLRTKTGVIEYMQNDETSESQTNSGMIQGGNANFKLGFQVFANDDDHIVFGHNGLGGSIGLTSYNKLTGENIQIAITLNRLSIDAKTTRKLIRKIFKDLGLKTPNQFLRE
jgi:hypothetical protein